MNFNTKLRRKKIKIIKPDILRANSLVKSSIEALNTANSIPLSDESSKTVFRELYESLREYSEAIGYLHGYKFMDHESIGYFINEKLDEENVYVHFDRFRKIRNSINYYGEDIDISTVKDAKKRVPLMIKSLSKHLD
ncbi:MAG: hypothetical protein ACMXYL_01735 [Candidatus Woesearchaeota archaeon]